jgi:hypothetical protein
MSPSHIFVSPPQPLDPPINTIPHFCNMSESHTPSSESDTPASLQYSDRKSDSDTTPSPSGGNRSPSFNPHTLSSKLALLEASESLAHAAETLSIAAKAMSKAAASLASASGYREYECNTRTNKARNNDRLTDWIDSPEWQKSSYVLPSFDDSASGMTLFHFQVAT